LKVKSINKISKTDNFFGLVITLIKADNGFNYFITSENPNKFYYP